MSDAPSPAEYLKDPLSEIARKERRNLLIASITGVLVSTAGIVPTEIAALGITFDVPAQNAFLLLVAGTIGYFILAFGIYGLTDWLVWRKLYHEYLERFEIAADNWSLYGHDEHPDDPRDRVPAIDWLYRWSPRAAYLRWAFELLFPFVVAAAAIALLIWRTGTL